MKVKPQLLFALAVFAFFALFVFEAREWRLQARLYPWVIGFAMLGLSLAHIVRELKGGGDKAAGARDAAPVDIQFTQEVDPALARRRALDIFAWIFGFFGGIWAFGFTLAIPVFVFVYLKVRSGEGWLFAAALAGIAWLAFWGLFERLLSLPFPEGALFALLAAA